MNYFVSLRGILSLVLSISIIIIIFQIVDFDIFFHSIKDSNHNYILSSFALTSIWPILATLRWSLTLKGLKLKIPFIKILNSVMISFSTNILAPAKSGDFIKMFVMGREFKKLDLATAIISERIGDLLILLSLSVIGSHYINNLFYFSISLSILFLIFLFIIIFSLIKINISNNLLNKFLYVITGSSKIWYNKFNQMIPVLTISFANWFLASLQIYIFFLAFGENIDFFIVLAIFPLTVLTTLIPLTPGSIGLREASFMFLFSPYIDPNISVAVSLCYFLCSSCITSFLGVIFTFFLGIKYSDKV